MKGVLGGFKNMLRTWRINLKRKKKQKQKEIEEGKLAKYYSLKRLSYNTIALIYFPIVSFFLKGPIKKTIPLTNHKVASKIITIEKQLDKIVKTKQDNTPKQISKKLQTIEKQIVIVKKEVQKEQNIETKSKLEQMLLKVETKKEAIETKQVEKPIHVSKENIVRVLSKEKEDTNNNIQEVKEEIKKENKENYKVESPIKPILKKNKKDDASFIKKKNEELEEITTKLNQLEVKITSCKNYKDLYEYSRKLKELEEKLQKLKEACKKYSFEQELDSLIDKYCLSKNPKQIDETLRRIESDYQKIEMKKKEIYYRKEEVKKEDKNQEEKIQQKEKKDEKEEKKKKVDEFQISQQIILENIQKQQKMLLVYQREINKSKNKKKTLFSYLTNLSNQIIRLLFSFTPFGFIKNRILGTLVTSFLVNNSLRSMRKMLHQEEEINYEMIKSSYDSEKSILYDIYRICSDSLYRIDSMKQDLNAFQKEYPSTEIEQLLNQLNMMEEQITQEQRKAKIQGNIIETSYMKVLKKSA